MSVDIYLESGSKKTFAGAIEWPGWCRAGRDDDSAVQALLAYAPRYARAMGGLGFTLPTASDLRIVERLPGNPTTDFGAPDALPAADLAAGYGPLPPAAASHLLGVMQGCWAEYERIYQAAEGHALATGPRGGGRDLQGVTYHVLNGAASYLGRIGGKLKIAEAAPDVLAEWQRATREILAAMQQAAQGGVPEQGPRGGKTWPLTFFIRRYAWHVLDHAWEIEDRVLP